MEKDDLLGLNLSLTVSPVIMFSNGTENVAPSGENGRFQLYADATIQFSSFSRVLNSYLAGKRFSISEGLFAKHIVIRKVAVSGNASGALLMAVQFTGSFTGSLTFNGVPVLNDGTNTLVLLNPVYDLQTNNLLLKGAKLLFAARIEKELKKATRFSFVQLLANIQKQINENLNKEWGKGIRGAGAVKDLRLLSVQVLPQHLSIRAACEGSLQITISETALNLKR